MAGQAIGIKFHKRGEAFRLKRDIDPSVPGFVLRDKRDHEHHFGGRELVSAGVLFTYVASYSPGAGPEREYGLSDELTEGFEVVSPTLGPNLSPLTRAAAEYVINECAR